LREFTPHNARFLDEIYRRASRLPFSRPMTSSDLIAAYSNPSVYPQLRITKPTDPDEKGENPMPESRDFPTAIDVLLRHRILGESTTPNPIDVSKIASGRKWTLGLPRSIETTSTTGYHLTALGISFVKACQAPLSTGSV
jgi:hypothetical protein